MRSPFGADAAVAACRREAFFRGMRAVAPATVATGTWGLVTGMAMVKVGLTTAQALGMSLFVFAGSAQLAALPLMVAGAPLWVVLLTATVVNLRFVIFSAGMQPFFRHYGLGRRMLLGYITGDTTFALFLARFADAPPEERGSTPQVWFFLGTAACNWMSWQAMSVLGIFLAAQVPGTWGLEFVSILALVALTLPMINSRPALAGAVTAGVVAIACAGLPLKLGLVAAVVVGIAVAMGMEVALERTGARA